MYREKHSSRSTTMYRVKPSSRDTLDLSEKRHIVVFLYILFKPSKGYPEKKILKVPFGRLATFKCTARNIHLGALLCTARNHHLFSSVAALDTLGSSEKHQIVCLYTHPSDLQRDTLKKKCSRAHFVVSQHSNVPRETCISEHYYVPRESIISGHLGLVRETRGSGTFAHTPFRLPKAYSEKKTLKLSFGHLATFRCIARNIHLGTLLCTARNHHLGTLWTRPRNTT
jgi:hypothetical protein